MRNTAFILAVLAGALAFGDGKPEGPWSHRNFQDEPGDFRFAIIPDRGGGDYRGAFTNALRCADLMHPEFVMSVGDLINGFAGSVEGFRRQQAELTNFVSRVRAPFFYTVGNHDINVAVPSAPKGFEISGQVWREHFGERTYYSFVYKNCLFLVLDTMDGRGRDPKVGITSAQYGWIRKTLAENADVCWTCIFMHQPSEWNTVAWQALEKEALVPRGRYTVFAGDWHTYFHVRRYGFDYYILSVAGGVSNMHYRHKKKGEKTPQGLYGQEYGEMDHIMWVTMTANGPEVVNLKLDGVLPGNYLNRANSKDDTMLKAMDIPAAGNIACGKPYVLSRPPNYALSKDEGDAVQLTDGRYAASRGDSFMWTDRQAVTWRKCDVPIGITVDLGRIEPIAGFSVDFAAGMSGVPYPNGILVYTSDNGANWRFLGDLYAASRRENGPPQMNGYEIYRAKSLKMPTQGRFVRFVILAGAYFCTSEVEIYRGRPVPPAPALVKDPFRHAATGRIVGRIQRDLERVAPDDAELRRKLGALVLDEGLKDLETSLPLNDVHREIWARNACRLRAAGFAKPALWTNDRWENLDPLSVPPKEPVDRVLLSVEMMRGETRSTAVNILNPTEGELPCEFSVEGLPEEACVDCREVLYTDTRLLEPVSGALRPGRGRYTGFRIPAGVSKQVWIAFAKPRLKAGVYEGKVRAKVGGGPDLVGDIRLVVRDLDFPNRPRVHVGGWDYSVGDCSFYRAPGNAAANQAMMREIYTDVFWAQGNVLPKGAKYDEAGALTNAVALDWRLWDEWVARFPDARRYAVYLSAGSSVLSDGRFAFAGEPVGTPRFQRMAADYVRAWREHVIAAGIDPKKVLVLVVDEPAEWQPRSRELPELIVAWAKVIRHAAPEFTIWEDPDYSGDPLQAGREMYDCCDALSPQVLKAATVGKGPALNRAFFVPLAEKGKELWLYSCSGPSRAFDPIVYYRQMFWLAYQWKAVGCQYWAFGCGGGIGDSWHAYRQTGVEYSPYFVSPTGVMASKQSEGIKEGVQDYEYLKMLEDAIAQARAKGVDVSAAERLLADAPAQALNQTGRDGREKYVRADAVEWNLPKDRLSAETARLRVLRELDSLRGAPGQKEER